MSSIAIFSMTKTNKTEKNNIIVTDDAEKQLMIEFDLRKPKNAAYQTYNELWIDDTGGSPGANGTWSYINQTYSWCTWTGSEYILEDITLTNPDNTGNTLLIANSTVPFIIKNCTISNSQPAHLYAGIKLINASNGKILDCDISNSYYGIFLTYLPPSCFSRNNLIINNTIDALDYYGVRIDSGCYYNDIINNTITNYGEIGISLITARECLIENNTLYGGKTGIWNYYWSDGAVIRNNTISYCTKYGIYISNSLNVIISGNTMLKCGIYLYGSSEIAHQSLTIYDNNTVNGKPVYFYTQQNSLNTYDFSYAGQPGQIILVSCNYSIISDFNISLTSVGIQLLFSSHNTISSNFLKNCYYGIKLYYFCEDNTIFNNTVKDVDSSDIYISNYCDKNIIIGNKLNDSCVGINLYENCNDNQIKNNNVINSSNQGICLTHQCCYNEIHNNNVINSSNHGIYLYYQCCYNEITQNIAEGCNDGIHLLTDCNHNLILNNNASDNSANGICLWDCHNNQILKNLVHDTPTGNSQNRGINLVGHSLRNNIIGNEVHNMLFYGIYLFDDCGYNNISYNDVRSEIHGIFLTIGCDNNTIFRNNISANGQNGIYFYNCLNNSIIENEIKENDYNGISISNSNETYIAKNDIIHNGYGGGIYSGIFLSDAYYTNITENGIIDNEDYGIWLYEADNNNIFGNVIRENTKYGIFVDGGAGKSENNSIILNFFKDNTDWHVYIELGATGNELNNTFIGNWWDNYTGDDEFAPIGIGDNPHLIPNGFQDNLPIVDDTAPIITILNPKAKDKKYNKAPDFNVRIQEKYIYKMWYTLDNWKTNVTFTKNGTINQALWNALDYGSVVIKFYAEDKAGQNSTASVSILKNPPAALPPTAADDDDDDTDDTGAIVVVVVVVVICCVGVGIGVIYILIQKGIIGSSNLKRK